VILPNVLFLEFLLSKTRPNRFWHVSIVNLPGKWSIISINLFYREIRENQKNKGNISSSILNSDSLSNFLPHENRETHLKIGFRGSEVLHSIFPSIVGGWNFHPKHFASSDFFIGDEAIPKAEFPQKIITRKKTPRERAWDCSSGGSRKTSF
jgi:hypothetical protein